MRSGGAVAAAASAVDASTCQEVCGPRTSPMDACRLPLIALLGVLLLTVVAVFIAACAYLIFSDSLKSREEILVREINRDPQATWSARQNTLRLSDLDYQAIGAQFHKRTAPKQDVVNHLAEVYHFTQKIGAERMKTHVRSLEAQPTPPDFFDARIRWPKCASTINYIEDQAECGACWAIASTSLVTDRLCISGALRPPARLSTQQILDCCNYCGTCNGSTHGLGALYYWMEQGLSEESCYPYMYRSTCGAPCHPLLYQQQPLKKCRKHCVDGSRQLRRHGSYVYAIGEISPNSYSIFHSLTATYKQEIRNITVEEVMKRELMTFGPVLMCFNVFDDFFHYNDGVYNVVESLGRRPIYDHCVRVIGWGVEAGSRYLLAVNSWSPSWAKDGTFKISLDMLYKYKDLRSDFYAGV